MPCRASTLDPLPTRDSAENVSQTHSHCQAPSWDQHPVPASLWHLSNADPPASPSCAPSYTNICCQRSPQPNALLPQLPAAPTAARDAALPTALLSPTKAYHICSGTEPQRSPSTTAGISVLAKSWHIPQRFHGHPNMHGTFPLKGASPTKPNHRHPRVTQRAKPCPSVRAASLTAGVPRAVTCLWFPSSPPGSAPCRPDPMQDQGLSLQLCPALPGDSQCRQDPGVDGPWRVWYSRFSSGAAP